MELIRVYCSDLWELKLQDDCCQSCHDEWDEGYGEPLEEIIKKFDVEFQFFTCCSGNNNVVDKLTDEDLKKILEFKKKR